MASEHIKTRSSHPNSMKKEAAGQQNANKEVPLITPVKKDDPSEDLFDKVNQELSRFKALSKDYHNQQQEILKTNKFTVKKASKFFPAPLEEMERLSMPEATIREIQREVKDLKQENLNLESELNLKTRHFRTALVQEAKIIEDNWKDKVTKLTTQEKKFRTFSEQLMNDNDAPIWMVAYSDMATLLLTFFILYYSIASMNVAKFKAAILGDAEAPIGLVELVDSVKIKRSIVNLTGMQSNDILSDLRSSEDNFAGALEVITHKGKVVFRVPAKVLFISGSPILQKEGRPVLDDVIEVLKKYPQYQINIQGHTDDIPIHTPQFPSNWELSAARATSVLRHFLDREIEAERLTATGFADTFPLYSNDTEAGRSRNRRVEFVLEKK